MSAHPRHAFWASSLRGGWEVGVILLAIFSRSRHANFGTKAKPGQQLATNVDANIRIGTLRRRPSLAPADMASGSGLLHKLKDCEVTYAELATRLKKHGFRDETEASITNKLKRGTFSATWFLACLAALELDGVALEEI